jgi:hypothetical protein
MRKILIKCSVIGHDTLLPHPGSLFGEPQLPPPAPNWDFIHKHTSKMENIGQLCENLCTNIKIQNTPPKWKILATIKT